MARFLLQILLIVGNLVGHYYIDGAQMYLNGVKEMLPAAEQFMEVLSQVETIGYLWQVLARPCNCKYWYQAISELEKFIWDPGLTVCSGEEWFVMTSISTVYYGVVRTWQGLQEAAQEAKSLHLICKEYNGLVEINHEPETKLEYQFHLSFLMSLGAILVHILENFVWDPGLRFILEDKDVLKGNGLSRIKATYQY